MTRFPDNVRLEPTGFTYDPNDFMKKKIFYYNFVWMKDFGETSMNNLLDMVKVSQSTLQYMSPNRKNLHC